MSSPLAVLLLSGCLFGNATVVDEPQPTPTAAPTPTPTVVPSPQPQTPTPVEDCTNETDDDGDGAIDCEDPDCAPHPSCPLFPLDTPLYGLAAADWAQICAAYATPTAEQRVTCEGGVEFSRDAMTQSQSIVACIETYGDSAHWTCDTTFGEFVVGFPVLNVLTCDVFDEPEVQPLLECLDPMVVTPPPPTPVCEVVVDVHPANGSTDAWFHTELRWDLSDVDLSATATVTDPGGATVPGTGVWDGDTYRWTPDTPFSPSTTYTSDLTFCGTAEHALGSFTTSTVGSAVVETDLVDNTYAIDLNDPDVYWRSSAAIGPALDFPEILLSVTSADALQVELIMGMADSTGNQDLCVETSTTTSSFADNPSFATGALPVPLDGGPIEFAFAGAFSPNGDAMVGVEMTGELDTRILLTGSEPLDTYCQLVAAFGNSCVACADGSGPYCLGMAAVLPEAPLVSGVVVQEVSTSCP